MNEDVFNKEADLQSLRIAMNELEQRNQELHDYARRLESERNLARNIQDTPYQTPRDGQFEERGTESQIAALYAALASARGEFGPVSRSRTVKMDGPKGYKFDYAPMEELLAATVPALSKHGLAILMPFTRSDSTPECAQNVIVCHKGGGRLVYRFLFHPIEGDEKKFGGQTTYLQRYCYRSVLNLAADGDLDDMPTRDSETSGDSWQRNRNPPPKEAAKNNPPFDRAAPRGHSGTETADVRPAKTQAISAPVGSDHGKEQLRQDMLAAAKAVGIRQVRDLANAIFGAVYNGEVIHLGDPIGSSMSAEDMTKAIEFFLNKKAAG